MGFGGYVGGPMLCVLAVVLGVFGLAVVLGVLNFFEANIAVPLGIGLMVVALFLFLFGLYSYKSAKPQGTLNVHNQ